MRVPSAVHPLERGTVRMASAMDFDLSPDHELIRRTVREFAEGEVAPVAEELDRTKSFPYEIVAKLGELNLMGIPFPQEYGGGGGDTLAYALAVEELTRVDSSVAITLCAHTSLGTQPIYLFGSEEQKREWMPRLCSGERLGAFGLTEPEAGSDAGNTRTRARLHGRRVGDRRRQAVHHQRRHRHLGRSCASPPSPARRRGRQGDLQHHRAQRHPRLRAGRALPQDGLERLGHAPADVQRTAACREANLLGPRGAGFKQFLHILDIGRIGVAAMGVGLAQGALDEALKYAKQRKAFGKPISKFQAIQGKLADMSTEIAAARLLVYKAAREKDAQTQLHADGRAGQAEDRPPGRALRRGGRADPRRLRLIEEYPVCRFYRDAKILTIGEGTDEVQQMVIATRARRPSIAGGRGARADCARAGSLAALAGSSRDARPPRAALELGVLVQSASRRRRMRAVAIASTSLRRLRARRSASCPRRGCARGARAASAPAPRRPCRGVASVLTIGTRQLPRASSGVRSRFASDSTPRISRTIVSVSGWSALLMTITSGISITPAFSAWIESPEPGISTSTIVSAWSMMSISACPTPTVSTNTSSRPAASSSSAPAAPPRRGRPARRGWPSSG